MWRDWSIGSKVSAAAFGIVSAVFLAFVVLVEAGVSRLAEAEAAREVGDKTRMLSDTVGIVDADLRKQVTVYAKLFKSKFPDGFTIDAGNMVKVGAESAPALSSGKMLNLDFSVPDDFTRLTGVYATVFVRRGDDFVRVTTSHKKENGERAIGTKLDHAHPGYRKVLEGQTYAGPASLFGGMYMTNYEPIRNAAGQVIGILYVGVGFDESLLSLKNKIKGLKLGETGHYFALEARAGKDLGKLLIHAQAEGRNALAAKDDAGGEYIRGMLERKQGVARYTLDGRERIAAYDHIKSWDMVVVGEAVVDEVTAPAAALRNRLALVGLALVALVAALLYPLVLVLVKRPLEQALRVARTVAEGDLGSRIEVRSKDECGKLMAALKDMNDSLAAIVGQVRSGTLAIESTAVQMAEGNRDLASRTEEQASSIEETAASMTELTRAMERNSASAQQADALAQSASEVARKGGAVVSQVVATMASIKASAQKIADITGVIDGLAFQTNILALNAAVEAARAGEQGRGFAVVATEVRTLAQRSAAAAKEIKVLIGASVEQVELGDRLVANAGATMEDIVASVSRVTGIMDEMQGAGREQEVGINEVSAAVGQMDQAVQSNASLVEQAAAAAAADALEGEAARLARMVQFFRLADQREPAAAAPAAPPARAASARKPGPPPERIAA
ncbi:methyl-accepting chemotaxis protein [Pseudoduganella namucuonensis]|uniref:Methyl-accepting chemotaxis protein-2, aspartate sensor receptor n=1 Tax=Pseudoduganella namucuonensis TaxID=1035707 RepID=A0A1I7JPV1_9BURK|nr:Cache 3/Cache 2 fusion domain-containing protein [Pseudoduganella namucuonensis]SFU87180.1 methyl-accepting chemotaxis protein-2, aspartate sensor receptor [Pseudoduganella namucuonensis]